jgi:hypothetical protein
MEIHRGIQQVEVERKGTDRAIAGELLRPTDPDQASPRDP